MAKSSSGKSSGGIIIGNEDSGVSFGGVGEETPDSRSDIQRMFVDELGFKDIVNTDDFDTAVLGAQGVRLNELERKYGAIKGSGSARVAAVPDASFIAAVGRDGAGNQTLIFNISAMGSVSKMNSSQRESEKSNWNMPTSGNAKSLAQYAVTHEYGHMLQNTMYQKALKGGYTASQARFARTQANHILKIATTKYGAKQSDVSRYGTKNTAEFFAEAFAGAHSGKPNAVGKAMREWLKGQGY